VSAQLEPMSLARRLAASERFRFVLVGGLNTVFGYAVFIVLQALFGDTLHYLGVLAVATVIAVLFAYVGHRWLTFQVRGQWLIDLMRFSSVYVGIFALNAAALPLLVEVAGIPPIIAQGVFVVVTTIASYLGHRNWSFRRPAA
jgi:putative flippase GtrA